MFANWMQVLEVEEAEVPIALCEVASLLPDTVAQIKRAAKEELTTALEEYQFYWARPILSLEKHPREEPGPGSHYVDAGALAALGVVSALLSATAAEVEVPSSEDLESLRLQLMSALEEVINAKDLAPSPRALMATRLNDILWALDHLRIAGPDGVAAALERLVGAIALNEPGKQPQQSSAFSHVVNVERFAWSLFRKGPEMHQAIEGWSKAIASLPSSGS